ncbi:MAG: SMI1/KNR4 family protein [Deltaproteobacteria bacterium]|nr:SMI1/KNR4 family protein [Deltaproteobacteria bacterium]
MKQIWERLERIAGTYGKTLALRPGLDEPTIAAAENKLGMRFPADYRASLLLHDGQEDEVATFEWLPGCCPLKPLANVLERWDEEQPLAEEFADPTNKTEGPLHTVVWHPRRIPIAGTQYWDGDNSYVDLHPSAAGTPGQIITFHTECDLVCLGASLRDALERYLAALDSGDWVYSETKKFVMPKDEPPDSYPNESYAFWKYLQRDKPAAPANKKRMPSAAKKPVKKPPPKKTAKKPAAKKTAKTPAAKKPAAKTPAKKTTAKKQRAR